MLEKGEEVRILSISEMGVLPFAKVAHS